MRFPKTRRKRSGFTLLEVLVAMGVFALATGGLLTTWIFLNVTAWNTTTYARRQSDQMRVIDYLKRDIRRAKTVEIYTGQTLVTGVNPGTELRLTITDYYADSREEDNAIGSRLPNTPTLAGGSVAYGGALTVRYYVSNGAIMRGESGTTRTVADSEGQFTLSFNREPDGLVRCRVFFNQLLQGGGARALRRQVDVLCGQRSQLQP